MSEPRTRFLVGRREGRKRLDHFLREKIPGLSRARIQRAIHERVHLSWTDEVRPSTPVRPGGEVEIGYTPLVETLLQIRIPTIDEGPGWLAVDKPSGIPVHPVNKVRENSVIRMLRRQTGREDLRLVHRLDRETSGVLMLADNADTARELSMAFMNRRVHKEYLALVRGRPAELAGTIDLPVGAASDSEIYTRCAAGRGAAATTRWCVERHWTDRTLLRLFPQTGRRHQIRVHLEAIGHPILGDPLYGRPERDYLDMVRGTRDARAESREPTRQMLHCARVKFVDRAVLQPLDVVCPPPADFEAWCSDLPLDPIAG